MSKALVFIYGIVAYLIGMGGLTFFILYIGGWDFMPLHIDSGVAGSLTTALLVNTALIVLFGLHHTITARIGFKSKWQYIHPKAVERSTYVLLSGVLLAVICLFWQPLEGTLWSFNNEIVRSALITLQIVGWVSLVLASFMINHFELFGLQRVYFHFKDSQEPAANFTDRGLYKIVRHPIQLGIIIGMWSTPTMSMTHLMLASTMTIYIFIGLYYEETDLIAFLGDEYRNYQMRVHKLLPFPK
ncbi:MAG: methyltransferase family protein [Methylophagaceae bacterium]